MTRLILAVAGFALAAGVCRADEFTTLVPITSKGTCDRCAGYVMPGRVVPSPETVYRIDSDLPEIFVSTGVLYGTMATLPPFKTKDGRDVPENQRRQRNAGFATIDSSFEVFLYHMSNPLAWAEQITDPSRVTIAKESRRVVVYAHNAGVVPVRVRPRQIVEADGTMAKADGPETRLSRRVFTDQFERVLDEVVIPAGEGRAIGWTPRLGVAKDRIAAGETDATASDFVTGTLRADVEAIANKDSPGAASGQTSLEVTVIGVDAAVPLNGLDDACAALRTVGARSGEGAMDLTIPPPECHVRRVVGVFKNFIWQSDPIVLDAAELPKGAVSFLMAAPRVQTGGCPEAQQTQDMLLSPGYVHSDTVGNYMVEYLVTLTLVNPSDTPLAVDVRFGKQDADVGITWQITSGTTAATRDELMKTPVRSQWAGGWRKDDLADNTRSFFEERSAIVPRSDELVKAGAAPITLAAGERRTISLRLMPIGTSSLPFELKVVSNTGTAAR